MRSLGLLLLVVGISAGLFWLFGGGAEERAPGLSAEVEEALSGRAVAGELPAAPTPEPTPGGAGEREATPAAPERVVESPAPEREAPRERGLAFHGHFVLPDREPVAPSVVRAELRAEQGEVHRFTGAGVDSLSFDGLEPGRYTLAVEAEGYTHRPELLDLTDAPPVGRGGVQTVSERVTLWPRKWIPIVAVTEDGRPFTELATELGWQPKNLFVNAFEVRVSRELADPAGRAPATDPELATFRPPPGYQNVQLPGGVIGSLELHEEPPLWAGLWIHGVHCASGILRSVEEELVFLLDLEVMLTGLATVRLKLVDRDSGAPVVEAEATLKADTSAHRRGDLSELSPSAEGELVFEHVVPGEHELTIVRGGNIVQRMLRVSTRETLDLGEVAIGSGPALVVRVVDAQGEPVPAWVEIGPYERGRYVERLYPPNLHRQTDGEGVYEAPVPDRPSILRARPLVLNGRHRSYPEVGSLNHLIDPERLPPELVVVAEDPVDLRVEPGTPWVEGQRVTFEDELGLVVDVAGGENSGGLGVDLVPGTYTARRWEGERELGSTPNVVVSVDSKTVPCP